MYDGRYGIGAFRIGITCLSSFSDRFSDAARPRSSLLVKDDLLGLFIERQDDLCDSGQLELNFNC